MPLERRGLLTSVSHFPIPDFHLPSAIGISRRTQLLSWLSALVVPFGPIENKRIIPGSLPRQFLILLITFMLGLARTGAATELSHEQKIISRATLTLDDFLEHSAQSELPLYLQNAYGVLIVPDYLRGGFLVGAEHGYGILMARDIRTGVWSQPVFFEIYGGSLGLQIGGQTSEVIVTIMNAEAVEKLLSSGIKIGADASVAFGRMGVGVGAGTTIELGEDVYVFSRNKGLFGGVALEGSVVFPLDAWNASYYGQNASPRAILDGDVPPNKSSGELIEMLSKF